MQLKQKSKRKENRLTQNAKYFTCLPYAIKHTQKEGEKQEEEEKRSLETGIKIAASKHTY